MEKIVLELKDKEKYIGQYVKFKEVDFIDIFYAKVININNENFITNRCSLYEKDNSIYFKNNEILSLKELDEIEIITQEEFNEWLHEILEM